MILIHEILFNKYLLNKKMKFLQMIAYDWKDIFQAIDDACIQRFNTLGRKVLI